MYGDILMVTNKLVSIIIPTYNSANFIQEAIESCLSQTYRNIEIIIIDDGSIDETANLIKPYLSKHNNIYYYYQENQERSSARNKGLKIAKGEYIQFLDADDLIAPTKIQKQVDILEENKEYIAVYCNAIYFKNNILKQIYQPGKDYTGNIYSKLIEGNFLPIHSVLFRKTNIEFDEKLSCLEDWDFWLRLSKVNEDFYHLNEYLCYVRIHNNNTSKNFKRMLEGEIYVLDKLKEQNLYLDKIYYKLYKDYTLLDNKNKYRYFKLTVKAKKSLIFKCIYFLVKDRFKRIFNINKSIYR